MSISAYFERHIRTERWRTYKRQKKGYLCRNDHFCLAVGCKSEFREKRITITIPSLNHAHFWQKSSCDKMKHTTQIVDNQQVIEHLISHCRVFAEFCIGKWKFDYRLDIQHIKRTHMTSARFCHKITRTCDKNEQFWQEILQSNNWYQKSYIGCIFHLGKFIISCIGK